MRRFGSLGVLFGAALPLQAGMTFYDLNDVVRLRLEDISFFTVLLLACALGIRFLWNYLAKDFPRMPRLGYVKALCLTGLLSLLMLLVLTMIAGARELLTPGAWRRQTSEYRLTDAASRPLRRQSLEVLRAALQSYAQSHSGRFPSHDFAPEIPEKIWQAPDSVGTRYLYVGGLTLASATNVLACEPVNFGDERFVLLVNGEIRMLSTAEIRRRVGMPGP
jgi:hypothetical protein